MTKFKVGDVVMCYDMGRTSIGTVMRKVGTTGESYQVKMREGWRYYYYYEIRLLTEFELAMFG